MRYLGKTIFVGLLCFAYSSAWAQSDGSSFLSTLSLSAKTHYGFFLVNQPKSEYVRDSHTCFGELTISTQTDGKKQWQQANRLPQIGIGLLYGNSGSREYIGHIAALFPYMKFPLIKTAHSTTSFRLGFGAGWVQNRTTKKPTQKTCSLVPGSMAASICCLSRNGRY